MKRLTLTLILGFATSLIFAQQKILFKLTPELNQPVKYEMVMKMDIQAEQMMIMDIISTYSMTATEATTDELTITSTFDKITMDMNAGLVSMSYDSSKEPNGPAEQALAQQIKPILEKPITSKINRFGKTLSIDAPEAQGAIFDKQTMEKMFTTQYPDYAIAPGESWTEENELPEFNAVAKTTYTFVEKNNQGYKFNISGSVIDNEGKTVGETKGYTISDPKTLLTIYTLSETDLEVSGAKLKTSMELKKL